MGTVIEVKGNWRIDGHEEPLRSGQGVPAGAVLRPESVESEPSISIALLNGKYLGTRCESARKTSCTQGLRIPESYVEETSSIRRVVQTVMDVLLERPPAGGSPFSSTIIRAGRNAERRELVMPFEQDKPALLDSVISGLPAGEYTLESMKQDHAHWIPQKPIRWDSRGGRAELPTPAAGLYSVQFINEYREPVLDLALLVSPPDSFRATQASFEDAQRLCARWNGPDAADSAHEFLRAYLISLARKE